MEGVEEGEERTKSIGDKRKERDGTIEEGQDNDHQAKHREKRTRRVNLTNCQLPEWVESTRTHLLERSSDEGWVKLVDEWCRFEVKCSAMGGAALGHLPAAGRPAELSKWLKNRQYGAPPEIEDLGAFGEQWREWWKAMKEKDIS